MLLSLAIFLPRDEASITVSRHIIRDALSALGVEDDCVQDVILAQTEACTNVVQHSGPGDEYEMRVEIYADHCMLSVIDKGHGFDLAAMVDQTDLGAVRGRGIQLMRALVDDIHFVSDATEGTAVRLEKSLVFRDDAVLPRRARSSG